MPEIVVALFLTRRIDDHEIMLKFLESDVESFDLLPK